MPQGVRTNIPIRTNNVARSMCLLVECLLERDQLRNPACQRMNHRALTIFERLIRTSETVIETYRHVHCRCAHANTRTQNCFTLMREFSTELSIESLAIVHEPSLFVVGGIDFCHRTESYHRQWSYAMYPNQTTMNCSIDSINYRTVRQTRKKSRTAYLPAGLYGTTKGDLVCLVNVNICSWSTDNVIDNQLNDTTIIYPRTTCLVNSVHFFVRVHCFIIRFAFL
jgi:hypothetical protein